MNNTHSTPPEGTGKPGPKMTKEERIALTRKMLDENQISISGLDGTVSGSARKAEELKQEESESWRRRTR